MDNLVASVQVVYPLSASRSRDLETIARHIGADPRSLRYFQPKRRVRHLFAPRVDYRAAAFVKQELLARGGDAIVARHVIAGAVSVLVPVGAAFAIILSRILYKSGKL